MFFNLLILMTAAFAIMEWKNIGIGGGGSIGSGFSSFGGFSKYNVAKSATEKFQWRGEGMSAYKLKGGDSDIAGLAKIFGKGVGFGLLVYFLTLDGGVSTGLGLLLMYLEYKLK